MSAEGPAPVAYIDASALVKLVLPETESEALVELATSGIELVSSVIGATETRRAILSAGGGEELQGKGEEVIASITLVGVSDLIARRAGVLEPPTLRTLDVIHLATALGLGDELGAFIVYDHRLAEAARSHGLPVAAPGSAESGGGAETDPGR